MVVIFGVSRGLGYSLVNSYLSLNVNVIGVGRRNTIIHPFYRFLRKDLSQTNSWDELLDMLPKEIDDLTLIYNAGDLGEVGPIQSIRFNNQKLFQLNFFSWVEVVQVLLNERDRFLNVNFVSISSGAGRRGVAGWSQYGASKAALDNFMLCLKEEVSSSHCSANVFSISPGVMDTNMQREIRSFSPSDFPSVLKYIDLKANGMLVSTEEISAQIISFITAPTTDNVLVGVQDF